MIENSFNKTSLYQNFSYPKSNRDYIKNAYGKTPSVQYYNDATKIKKKNKKVKFALFSTALATFALICAITKNKKFDINLIKKFAQESVENVHEKVRFIDKPLNTLSSSMSNFTNVKDDLWDRFAKFTKDKKGLKWIDKIGESLTDFYRKTLYKSTKGSFSRALSDIRELAQKEGFSIEVDDFDKMFKEINGSINETIHQNGNRVSNNLRGEFIKKFTSSNIADTKIKDLDAIKNALKGIEIPQGASEELTKAIQEFNRTKINTAQKLIGKLRDINAGSAPTDLLTILGSLGLLGATVANEDDKQERKSIIINLGIPLITTLGSAMVGVVLGISGMACGIFGLTCGKIASSAAKTIDNKLKQKVDTKA